MQKQYTSSLTDAQWKTLSGYLPASMLQRSRKWPLRCLFDAILYVLKNGTTWRDLPHDFPPHHTVYYYFKTWRDAGLFELLNLEMSADFRRSQGRDPHPSVGIVDSQSSKTIAISHQNSGYDAAKRVKGRKRHLVVDTQGLVLTAVVHSAHVQDINGAKIVFERLLENRWDFPRLKVFFADAAYGGHLIDWVAQKFKYQMGQLFIVKRTEAHQFKPLPKRWIVERTLAWLTWNRRLAKDYERKIESAEAFIYLSMIRILALRLAKT